MGSRGRLRHDHARPGRRSGTPASAGARASRWCPTACVSIAPGTAAGGRFAASARPLVGYAGHLYPWKGVDLLIEAVAGAAGGRGLIVGGHEREPDLARVKAFAAQRAEWPDG